MTHALLAICGLLAMLLVTVPVLVLAARDRPAVGVVVHRKATVADASNAVSNYELAVDAYAAEQRERDSSARPRPHLKVMRA